MNSSIALVAAGTTLSGFSGRPVLFLPSERGRVRAGSSAAQMGGGAAAPECLARVGRFGTKRFVFDSNGLRNKAGLANALRTQQFPRREGVLRYLYNNISGAQSQRHGIAL